MCKRKRKKFGENFGLKVPFIWQEGADYFIDKQTAPCPVTYICKVALLHMGLPACPRVFQHGFAFRTPVVFLQVKQYRIVDIACAKGGFVSLALKPFLNGHAEASTVHAVANC